MHTTVKSAPLFYNKPRYILVIQIDVAVEVAPGYQSVVTKN